MKERAKRDAIAEEVTIQPLKELKEGETLPGTKKVELEDYKTNEMYNSKAPVVNPKYSSKKAKKTTPKGKFVGAATGKYYYKADSAQAKRIKPANRVYFKTEADARKKKYKKGN